MNTRTLLIIVIIVSVVLSAAVSVSVSLIFKEKAEVKTAFVRLSEVYEGFELTKQLSKKITETENARKNILDSLEFGLKAMQVRIGNPQTASKLLLEEFELNKENYFQKKEQFSEDNTQMVSKYNEQIWTQINQFISDYGKEKGYSYVFGADGGGSIMYGSESQDITKEVIDFVNIKFQGK